MSDDISSPHIFKQTCSVIGEPSSTTFPFRAGSCPSLSALRTFPLSSMYCDDISPLGAVSWYSTRGDTPKPERVFDGGELSEYSHTPPPSTKLVAEDAMLSAINTTPPVTLRAQNAYTRSVRPDCIELRDRSHITHTRFDEAWHWLNHTGIGAANHAKHVISHKSLEQHTDPVIWWVKVKAYQSLKKLHMQIHMYVQNVDVV